MSPGPVYLAGPIEATDDPHTWRDDIKRRYPDVEFIDPNEMEWDKDPVEAIREELEIVERHPILANNLGRDGPRTVGTHHEIAHALAHGNERIAAVCKGEPFGFIKYRKVRLFDTCDEALKWLVAAPKVADGGFTSLVEGRDST